MANPETSKISDSRKDPTFFLPDEPMSYEIKKKKKKKKRDQQDPLKDIEDTNRSQAISIPTFDTLVPNGDMEMTPALDPEVNIKVENIEVELDFNDFADNSGLMVEGPHSEDSQEPAVKIEQQNHEAVLLTFESVINLRPDFTPAGIPELAPTHVCKVCHLVFQSNKTLKMHQKRKHKSFRRTFKNICDYCGMAYEMKNSLAAHIKRKHGPDANPDDREERTCEICALVFKGVTRLRMHMRRKHGAFEEAFTHACQHCGLTYDKYRSLIVHIQRKHSGHTKPEVNQWYNCPFCPKIFCKRETYARHVQRNHKITEEESIKQEPSKDSNIEDYKDNETGEITCKECALVFSSVNFLKLHMRRKHNALKEDFRLKCRICNLSYNKIESLKRHVRRKHENETHCDVCNKDFDSKELYLNHSHVKMIQECSLCGLIFASQGGLAKHLRCTHKIDSPKTVFCSICNEGFHDKRQLKPHFLKVHLNVSYTCQFCKRVFRAKESYRRHVMFKHPSSQEFKQEMQKCEQCTETFKDEFELCRHIHTVHGTMDIPNTSVEIKKEDVDIKDDKYQCTKCPEMCLTWEQLKLHYELNHKLINETQCQVCGQLVPSNELEKHIKNQHTDNTMQCRYCEFKTDIKASMTQHTLRHKNATTMNCEYPGCKYKSFYEGAMKKHMIKHREQGVKLQCTQCPFQTMNKYILRYHEEAHETGKKRYMCDQCDYATILPANLVQHKYKHSTEKRFKCEVCPFATKYNTSLRFHVRKKHCDLPTFS